jgi:hypothetical protein
LFLEIGFSWETKTSIAAYFVRCSSPDSWDELKVMQEIQSAANNRIGNYIENIAVKQSYYGTSSSGYKIFISRHPQYNNNILTAYHEP